MLFQGDIRTYSCYREAALLKRSKLLTYHIWAMLVKGNFTCVGKVGFIEGRILVHSPMRVQKLSAEQGNKKVTVYRHRCHLNGHFLYRFLNLDL